MPIQTSWRQKMPRPTSSDGLPFSGTGACVTLNNVTSEASSKPAIAIIAGRSTVARKRRTPSGLGPRDISSPPCRGAATQLRPASPVGRPVVRDVEVLAEDLPHHRRRHRAAVSGALDDHGAGDLRVVV